MALPMIFLRLSFTVLRFSYGAVMLLLAAAAAVRERRRIPGADMGKAA